jgi:type IV pilus assembly protein PilE
MIFKAKYSQLQGRRWQGFTLIEVMIVVAIIAILASIAYPAYQDSVRRGQRAQAQAALLDAAQFMQRHYAATNAYNTPRGTDATFQLPNNLTRVPREAGTTQSYTIGIKANSLTATGYTLTATPTEGGMMNGDACGTFELDQTGFRAITKPTGSTRSLQDCWR